MSNSIQQKLISLQRNHYLQIVMCLWDEGPEIAHEEFPSVSVRQFSIANDYYNSLRCEGCMCGSCVNLGELASNLDASPHDLKPIANLAKQLAREELFKES